MQSPLNLKAFVPALALALLCAGAVVPAFGQASGPEKPAASGKPAPKSSLPDAALQRAKEAQQHLAANEPEKAIAILQELDKQYPGNPALSLRLAEVHDTLSRNGHALFYYRRYIKLAGPRAREMAAARVQSLELMAGIDDDAAAVARQLGEDTRPVATPAPSVTNVLAAARKDGSLVPIKSEEDLRNIRKLTAESPGGATPVPPPTNTPIVIPQTLSATPAPANPPAVIAPQTNVPPSLSGDDLVVSAPADPIVAAAISPAVAVEPVKTKASVRQSPSVKSNSAVYAGSTPKPDQDALMAQAFLQADEKQEKLPPATDAKETGGESAAIAAVPEAQAARPDRPVRTDAPSRLTGQAPVAFTSSTPAADSPRAAGFFHIAKSSGSVATVVVLNNLQTGVVTMSIIPPDDGEVLSAILMPGETKTLQVKPGRYQVKANAATTDYSPITLMDTQFQYKFEAGRQYTRRITQDSLQQIN